MSALLWIVIVGVLLTGGVFAYRRTQQKSAPKALPASVTRTLSTLQVNDIITHFDQDYIVEGKLTFREDGSQWQKVLLADGSDQAWLTVEEHDGLEVWLSRVIDDLSFTSRPPDVITYDGNTFELAEWGKAEVTQTGDIGARGSHCTYFDYSTPGGKFLTVEQWSEGNFEVQIGEDARPHAFEILPGDEVS